MKAILLSADDTIKRVYPESTLEELRKIQGFEGKVYRKDDVLEKPELFEKTEYIFSTWGMPVFEEDEIKKCFPSLKCVFYAAGSVQRFARPFLNCGVKVFSAWAANAVPVAEYTVAEIVLANKGFYLTSRILKGKDNTKARTEGGNYPGNYGAKVGIIGAGMIGKLVINMLKAYKLDVLVFDPFLPDSAADELGVKKVSLEELFSECNVISNHLANNEQTQKMLNYKLFSRMKPYSTFINTGRGAQVVEEDLIRHLTERNDVTAVLDVTMPEPPLEESKLYTLANCVLTPHIAGSSGNEIWRMAEYIVDEYKHYVSGDSCKYEVTLKMLETMA